LIAAAAAGAGFRENPTRQTRRAIPLYKSVTGHPRAFARSLFRNGQAIAFMQGSSKLARDKKRQQQFRRYKTMAKNILSLQKMQANNARGCLISIISWSSFGARTK
jgi:hypothetical protein